MPEGNFTSSQIDADQQSPQTAGIQWTASEFMAHHKGGNWYLFLILIVAAISGLVWLLTKDGITSGMIVVVGLLLAVVAARQPRTLNYHLHDRGVQVGEKFYSFAEFKSFSVIDEGAFNSIMLVPVKRFAPAVTMYCDPNDEVRIAQALSNFLPYEQREQDPIDRFMQRIRF